MIRRRERGSTRASLLWLLVDGAPAWLTWRMIDSGVCPALASVAKSGARAALHPPAPNCQTPPSLASLFTGCPLAEHGVTGFNVPDPSRDVPVTQMRSGFADGAVQQPLLWDLAEARGLRTALSHIPWAFPGPAASPESRSNRLAIEAYSCARSGAEAHRLRNLPRHREERVLELAGSPARLAVDGEVLTVRTAGSELRIPIDGSLPWTGRCLDLGDGARTTLHAWRAAPDREVIVAHTGCSPMRTTASAGWLARFERETGPFCGGGPRSAYRTGLLGPRLVDGGDGSAEHLLWRGVRACGEYFARAGQTLVESEPDRDLYVIYQPCLDEIHHEILGWCDPTSVSHDERVAHRLLPILESAYRLIDQQLERLLAVLPPDAAVVIGSDHGMAGLSHVVHVNEALARTGLLAFRDGSIDLPRTAILYHPANNGSLWLNRSERPLGTVAPEHAGDVVQRAARALEPLEHASGGRIFTSIQSPIAAPSALDHRLGDLLVIPARGAHLSAKPSPDGEIVRRTHKSASHLMSTGDPALDSFHVARGCWLDGTRSRLPRRGPDVLDGVLASLGLLS